MHNSYAAGACIDANGYNIIAVYASGCTRSDCFEYLGCSLQHILWFGCTREDMTPLNDPGNALIVADNPEDVIH